MERKMREYEERREESVRLACKLLLASATTSPRVGGVDEISIHVLDSRDEIEDLAIAIDRMAADNPRWEFFRSDAVQVRDSDVVMIMADRRSSHDPMDSNCNLCGHLLCDMWRDAERVPDAPSASLRRARATSARSSG